MRLRSAVSDSFALLAAATMIILGAGDALAQRNLTDIPDPDPAEELASFKVAEGFEVNLFAADPMIAKPIQMNFDAAGRLWIASSEVYPHIEPGAVANDRILIVEDVDGDGSADKTTVFADGLLIPTGVIPGDGGAYVANSTELVHLRDADGDGRADRREVVLSGFGTEDTHHIIHTFHWAPDGTLCFSQSGYIHSHVETPHGVRRLNGSGVWKLRRDTLELDIFARGMANPWGLIHDPWGQSFTTDGAWRDGINYVFPNSAFFTAVGVPRILTGLNTGRPKYCGLEIVDGRHFPDDWQGNLITNDFRGHRVCRFILTEEQSGYASREEAPLISSIHEAFRPVGVSMGPDGALYIADWYNPIIQHGEVDFRDPRRDHTRGRIWRVTAKGRPFVERPKLAGASTKELLDQLRSPEGWTRRHARRLLQERGKTILPALDQWVVALDEEKPSDASGVPDRSSSLVTDRGPIHARLEALWLYHSLHAPRPKLLQFLLTCDDHRARAAATRVLGEWPESGIDPLPALARQAVDSHPRVRLEAVCALGESDDPSAIVHALAVLDHPMDENIDYALWTAARNTASLWLPRLQSGSLSIDDPRKLEFVLRAVESPEVVGPLVQALTRGDIPPDREEGVLELIARHGSSKEMGLVFSLGVIDKAASPERQTRLLEALLEATRADGRTPAGDLSALGELLKSPHPALSLAAAEAIGLWKVEALRAQLTKEATSAVGVAQLAAIRALSALGGAESLETIDSLAGEDQLPELRLAAVVAMTPIDLEQAARRAAEWLSTADGTVDPTPMIVAFIERKEGPKLLAAAIEGQSIHPDVAKLAQRAVSASAIPDQSLGEAIVKAGGLSSPKRSLTPEEMDQFVKEVQEKGDAARGELLYSRKDIACQKCHAIAGVGGLVGPDLLSLGASAPIDYIIESILDPNKKIKENYNSIILTTDDGRVYSGVRTRDTGKEVVLRGPEDVEVRIPYESIEEQMPGGSLMPEGLADSLTRAELVDLVRFLSELGKSGPYGFPNYFAARRWETMNSNIDAERVLAENGTQGLLLADSGVSWSRAYAFMRGMLPLENLPAIVGPDGTKVGVARFQFTTRAPGKVELRFQSLDGLTVAVDGQPAAPEKVWTVELGAGMHTVTCLVDLQARSEPLLCQLREVAGSQARPEMVMGK